MQREDFEIIDGQQRITALFEYYEGNFNLFDPSKDDKEAKFPAFIKTQACPWAGLRYTELSIHLQEQFLTTSLPTAKIQTSDANEVRDLFVRLQSGLPLNAQETRDAWPGDFTEFVLALGGKPELARFPGHAFFQGPMGLTPKTDRGKARQFAAQISMLFFSHRKNGANQLPDINAAGINDFYYSNIDFDKNNSDAKRLTDILSTLTYILGAKKRPKLKAHDAIHLILFTDSLWDDYVRSWEEDLPRALDKFLEGLATAKSQKDSSTPGEFWNRYGQWTRVNSDRGERISYRHAFYTEKMLEYIGRIKLKDPNRYYGQVEREVLYFRNNKKCAVCGATISWDEAEIHHVIEHSKGGMTDLSNAALVHRACHPKGEAATKAFSEQFYSQYRTPIRSPRDISEGLDNGYLWTSKEGSIFLPNFTEIRMSYKDKDYFAKIENAQMQYSGANVSPAQFTKIITNTSRNAWRDIWIKFPGDDQWNLAEELRDAASFNGDPESEI